jgi:DNA-binding HxlR family transcriptional regulator
LDFVPSTKKFGTRWEGLVLFHLLEKAVDEGLDRLERPGVLEKAVDEGLLEKAVDEGLYRLERPGVLEKALD